jgi:hypothetical protein
VKRLMERWAMGGERRKMREREMSGSGVSSICWPRPTAPWLLIAGASWAANIHIPPPPLRVWPSNRQVVRQQCTFAASIPTPGGSCGGTRSVESRRGTLRLTQRVGCTLTSATSSNRSYGKNRTAKGRKLRT